MSNEEVIKSISSCPIESDASALKLAAVERMLLVTMLHEALSGAHTVTTVVNPVGPAQPSERVVKESATSPTKRQWVLPKPGERVRYCVAASGTIYEPPELRKL